MGKYGAAAIFDIDGVLVNTAEYHFLAWKALATRLGLEFTRAHNEQLKGVSRSRSLDILLKTGSVRYSSQEKHRLTEEKNSLYVSYLQSLSKQDLLPGAESCLYSLRRRGIKLALGSASKNALLILEKLGIKDVFDVIIDGNCVHQAKPNPEVFIMGADKLGVSGRQCVVFEDAAAGIQAAIAAGMIPIGVGKPENLPGAHIWINSLADFPIAEYFIQHKTESRGANRRKRIYRQ